MRTYKGRRTMAILTMAREAVSVVWAISSRVQAVARPSGGAPVSSPRPSPLPASLACSSRRSPSPRRPPRLAARLPSTQGASAACHVGSNCEHGSARCARGCGLWLLHLEPAGCGGAPRCFALRWEGNERTNERDNWFKTQTQRSRYNSPEAVRCACRPKCRAW